LNTFLTDSMHATFPTHHAHPYLIALVISAGYNIMLNMGKLLNW
jgi:hypothetical protein